MFEGLLGGYASLRRELEHLMQQVNHQWWDFVGHLRIEPLEPLSYDLFVRDA